MTPRQAIHRQMGFTEWVMLIALSVLWGGSFFFVSVAVDSLPPFTIVVLRVGLAALALNIVVFASGLTMPRGGRLWAAFFAMGFLNNLVPFSLFVWGQATIAGGLASILNAATPLFTVVVAHFLTVDEKMGVGRLSGVLIGFGGVVIMIGPDALGGLDTAVLAQLACLGAALSYAFAGVFGRRFARLGVVPLVTATGQVSASTVMLLPVALILEKPWTLQMPEPGVWGAVIGLALLSTALAYIIYFRILATAGATNIVLVTFLVPLSAILLGVTFLGEQLLSRHFAGMVFIGLGLAAIDGRWIESLRRRRSGAATKKEAEL
jgi:drug/metabolite transporter (DMT)-like permease